MKPKRSPRPGAPRRALLLGLAALLGVLAAPRAARAQASGQPFLPIAPGRPVDGSLGPGDPKPSARGPFKVYQFHARQGERLVATLRSTDFDAFLRVGRQLAGITDEIDSGDDTGGAGSARVRFTAPVDGDYLLIAQSLEEGGAGAFTLDLEPAPTPSTAAPHPIRVGQSVDGELAETDAVQADDDSFYDTWSIDARAGQRLLVRLESGAFDAFVSIGQTGPDGGFAPLASNDDGDQPGDTTNARMHVRLSEAGTYQIRVGSIGVATGPYRLSVEPGPQPPAQASRAPIQIGEEVQGRLDDKDAVLDDESYYEYWTFAAKKGDRLRIRMTSKDFDTFLTFGRMIGAAFSEITADDDTPTSTDSEIEVTIARDGEYALRASTMGPGSSGRYSLSVTRER